MAGLESGIAVEGGLRTEEASERVDLRVAWRLADLEDAAQHSRIRSHAERRHWSKCVVQRHRRTLRLEWQAYRAFEHDAAANEKRSALLRKVLLLC